jgi:hypothetical protein
VSQRPSSSFLAPQQPGGQQQAPDGGDQGDEAADPPGHETADGADLAHGSEKRLEGGVAGQILRHPAAVGLRGEGGGVTGRHGEDEQREYDAPDARPDDRPPRGEATDHRLTPLSDRRHSAP